MQTVSYTITLPVIGDRVSVSDVMDMYTVYQN